MMAIAIYTGRYVPLFMAQGFYTMRVRSARQPQWCAGLALASRGFFGVRPFFSRPVGYRFRAKGFRGAIGPMAKPPRAKFALYLEGPAIPETCGWRRGRTRRRRSKLRRCPQ